jgi:hypothetical protein
VKSEVQPRVQGVLSARNGKLCDLWTVWLGSSLHILEMNDVRTVDLFRTTMSDRGIGELR